MAPHGWRRRTRPWAGVHGRIAPCDGRSGSAPDRTTTSRPKWQSKSVKLEVRVETYNAFNHANFGSYVTQESAANYRQPTGSTNVAYQPRMLQLGFRFSF